MALETKIKLIVEEYDKYRKYLLRNHELFDIFEGNLRPYVENIMRSSLSSEYFEQIKHRIMPINVLRRIIDKLAKVYSSSPIRTTANKQEVLDFYSMNFNVNQVMNSANEFSNLFKGYALEPFLRVDKYSGEQVPSLRVLPFDRFFVIGEDLIDPLKPTIFVKLMGKVKLHKTEEMSFFAYTDDEFLAFTESGKILTQYLEQNEGVNVYGKIPFIYGNRSNYNIMPTQDTDVLEMAKLISVMLSDLAGMIMFSCFPINYGVDVDTTNLKMMPNSFWSFKSDPQSQKTPSIGTITPSAEVDKVLNFITSTMGAWLETKGIKVGGIGTLTGDNFASGISKIIDEMDTFEARKVEIQNFKVEEKELWKLVGVMHNTWVEQGMIKGQAQVEDNWNVDTQFDEPTPFIDRKSEVETIRMEVDGGFLDQKTAIMKLYPDLSEEQVDERMEIIASQYVVKEKIEDDSTESDDSDQSEVQQES